MPTLVAAITIIVFLPALNAGFVSWDDDKNFVENVSFRGLGPTQLRWMWSTFHLGHYVPLSWMTLGLDYLLWGMDPPGYHLTNIVLHAGATVMFYWVARRVLARALEPESGTSLAPASAVDLSAAFAALCFSIHPLRVESVAWVTERRDVLSGLLYFTAVLCYLRAGDRTPRGRRWYVAALAAAIGAMLSKASAVTLPAALLILEVYPYRRIGRGETAANSGRWFGVEARAVYTRIAPFAIIAAGVSAIAFVALQPEPQLGMAGKLAVSGYSIGLYITKTFAPFNLAPLYAMPERVDPTQPVFLLALAATASVSAAAFSARKRWPAAAFAWMAFIVILFPLLGVHQNGPQIAADRYTYNAAPALALLAAGLFHRLRTRLGPMTVVAAGALLFTLGALTWRQTTVWHDSATLWTQVLRVEPGSPLAHNNMGNLVMRAGRHEDAMTHYRAAVAAKPEYAEAHDNLGVALAASGRLDEAIEAYRRALAIQPALSGPQNNWGAALARRGDIEGAIEHFRLAIVADPSNSDAYVNWGNAAVRLGRTDEAIAHFRDALRYRPDNADAHHNWGVALARAGEFAAAAAQFEQALAIQPGHAEAREYLGRVNKALLAPSPAAKPR